MSDPELDPGPNPRECGALLSEGDPRDRLYAAATAPWEEIPGKLDLTPRQSTVMNQQGEPICVACALCGIAESQDFYYPTDLSECWLYARRRNPGDGMVLREALKLMQKEGTCTEGCYPLSRGCRKQVCSDPWIEAEMEHYRIGTYHRVYNDIPGTLWKNRLPIFAAVPVYNTWRRDGRIGMPKGEFLGFHAILIVGYDLAAKRLKFKNSWGEQWGNRGYGTLPLNYPIPEAWVVRPRAAPKPKPEPKPRPEPPMPEHRIEIECREIKNTFFGARLDFVITTGREYQLETKPGFFNFRKRLRRGENRVRVLVPYKFNHTTEITFVFRRGNIGIVAQRRLRVTAKLEDERAWIEMNV